MMKLKKIFALSLLLCHNVASADDTGKFIAGLFGAAAVVVGGRLWWIVHQENQKQRDFERAESLKKQIQGTLDESAGLLSDQSKYAYVDFSTGSSAEKELESNIVKLGKTLKLINHHNCIQSDLSKDLEKINSFKSKLQSIASCHTDACAQARSQVALYYANAQKLSSAFDRHSKFFKGHTILNFYDSLPTKNNNGSGWYDSSAPVKDDKVLEWIYSKSQDKLYPLVNYKKQTESDVQFIDSLEPIDFVMYPEMAKKLHEVKSKIEQSAIMISKAGKLQAEMQIKLDNELAANRARAMQEEAQAKLTVAEAQKRAADAQEYIVRQERIKNENKDKEIAALRDATRVKEMRIPIDLALIAQQQERNRLEAKTIEENRRRTTEIEYQNRLQADRNRIENQRLEELRRANGGFDNKNRELTRKNDELQRKNDDCKRQADALIRSLRDCETKCASQQRPTPSAPPAPSASSSGSSVPNIGSATLRQPERQPAYNPNYRP